MKREKLGKINKLVVFRNMVLFWLVVFFLIQLLGFTLKIFDIDIGMDNSVLFMLIFLIFFTSHHIFAIYNKMKGRLFSSIATDSIIYKTFNPKPVQNGRVIGVRLETYVKNMGNKEWIENLVDYIHERDFSKTSPLILRSHLLSSTRIRNNLVKKIMSSGKCCTVSTNLPIVARFRLLWLTPAFQGVFQLYIPTFNDLEAEIIIRPVI